MPACDAVTVQAPVALIVTSALPAVLEHAPLAANVTGLSDPPPVAVGVNRSPTLAVAGNVKLMIVCVNSTVTLCVSGAAGAKLRLPACDAVTMQVPVESIVICAPPAVFEHAPPAAYTTGLSDPPPVACSVNGASTLVTVAGSVKPVIV